MSHESTPSAMFGMRQEDLQLVATGQGRCPSDEQGNGYAHDVVLVTSLPCGAHRVVQQAETATRVDPKPALPERTRIVAREGE